MAGIHAYHRTLLLSVLGLLFFIFECRVVTADQCTAGAGPPSAPTRPQLTGDQTVEGSLTAQTAQIYDLQADPGDYVQGSITGKQLQLVLCDSTGKSIRVLAKGLRANQDFRFVVGNKGPYQLKVTGPVSENFRLHLHQLIPENERGTTEPVLESPRLRALQQTLAQGGSTDSFWEEVKKQGAPLIEQQGVFPPLAEDERLVTFLWRGARQRVKLFSAPSGDHDEMQRLGKSDVWFGSYRVPRTARIGYKLAPDIPQLKGSFWERRRAILATAQHDPFNDHFFPADAVDQFDGESVVELPDAPSQPWIVRNGKNPAGKVERQTFTSQILGNKRDLFIYRPPHFIPASKEHNLLIVFDGERYVDDVNVPVMLDNLIAADKIAPTVAVLISNPSSESRSAELPCNPLFARFLAEELFPWIQDRQLGTDRKQTMIAGASYGGLAAAYAGLTHPELFGKVYSQSGSFWWSPRSTPDKSEVEPEWLTRQFVSAPVKYPVHFHLEAGLFESNPRGGGSILGTTRHLRDILQARGHAVTYQEYASGHGYYYWRYSFPDGLLRLLGTDQD